MGIIYMMTSPSGKAYIGQTTKALSKRMAQHQTKTGRHCPLIHGAIMEYGFHNFKVETLMHVPDELLSFYEMRAIELYGTQDRRYGYNLTAGGKEAPLKNPEVAARLKETWKDPEVKARLVQARIRQWKDPENLRKMAEGVKAAHARPETKAKYRAGWKKAQSTPEAREKNAAAQRLAWKDPANRKARSNGMKKRNREDPSVNARRSETLKAYWAKKRDEAGGGRGFESRCSLNCQQRQDLRIQEARAQALVSRLHVAICRPDSPCLGDGDHMLWF